MKALITTLIAVFCLFLQNIEGQNNPEVTIEIDYYPPRSKATSMTDYVKGAKELDYAYHDYKERASEKLDYIDYWRIAVAYARMGVQKEDVYQILLKSKQGSEKGFCIIFNHFRSLTSFYKSFLGKYYVDLCEACLGYEIKTNGKFPRHYKLKKLNGQFQWMRNKDNG